MITNLERERALDKIQLAKHRVVFSRNDFEKERHLEDLLDAQVAFELARERERKLRNESRVIRDIAKILQEFLEQIHDDDVHIFTEARLMMVISRSRKRGVFEHALSQSSRSMKSTQRVAHWLMAEVEIAAARSSDDRSLHTISYEAALAVFEKSSIN